MLSLDRLLRTIHFLQGIVLMYSAARTWNLVKVANDVLASAPWFVSMEMLLLLGIEKFDPLRINPPPSSSIFPSRVRAYHQCGHISSGDRPDASDLRGLPCGMWGNQTSLEKITAGPCQLDDDNNNAFQVVQKETSCRGGWGQPRRHFSPPIV